MKRIKIYVATPVNGRKEATLQEKKKTAEGRCIILRENLQNSFHNADVVCSFDVCPSDEETPEHIAMGRCIDLLMTCDCIFLDYGWRNSKGCQLEYKAAELYGLHIMGDAVDNSD